MKREKRLLAKNPPQSPFSKGRLNKRLPFWKRGAGTISGLVRDGGNIKQSGVN
jgi:hypothetical protein